MGNGDNTAGVTGTEAETEGETRRHRAASCCRIGSLEAAIFILWLLLKVVNIILIIILFVWRCLKAACFVVVDRVKEPPGKKEVIVVGASFGGLAVRQMLAGRRDVSLTLVDFKDYFEYTPGVLRCFIDPSYLRSITRRLPQNRNQLVLGELVGTSTEAVMIKKTDGSKLELKFDYLVLACGSTYQQPIKPVVAETSLEQRCQSWQQAHDVLKRAKRLIVVGGGAVGVELIGEILTKFPDKSVILADRNPTILQGFGPKCREHALRWMRRMDVELRLGQPISEIGSDSITLGSGEKLNADVVYKCVGVLPNTGMVKSMPAFSGNLGFRDSLVVNDHLQVGGCANIFCIGDMMTHRSQEIKLGHTAELNGHAAAHNILALAHGKRLLKYPEELVGGAVTPKLYAVSLGRYDASLGFNWLEISGWLAALMKWLLEWTKVSAAADQPVGVLFWIIADAVSLFLGRTCIKPREAAESTGTGGTPLPTTAAAR